MLKIFLVASVMYRFLNYALLYIKCLTPCGNLQSSVGKSHMPIQELGLHSEIRVLHMQHTFLQQIGSSWHQQGGIRIRDGEGFNSTLHCISSPRGIWTGCDWAWGGKKLLLVLIDQFPEKSGQIGRHQVKAPSGTLVSVYRVPQCSCSC